MPTTGFEPARLLAPPPQDGMSTNFTTWASTSAAKNSVDKDTFFLKKAWRKKTLAENVNFHPYPCDDVCIFALTSRKFYLNVTYFYSEN